MNIREQQTAFKMCRLRADLRTEEEGASQKHSALKTNATLAYQSSRVTSPTSKKILSTNTRYHYKYWLINYTRVLITTYYDKYGNKNMVRTWAPFALPLVSVWSSMETSRCFNVCDDAFGAMFVYSQRLCIQLTIWSDVLKVIGTEAVTEKQKEEVKNMLSYHLSGRGAKR